MERYNVEGLKALQGDEFVFEANITGDVQATDFKLETEITVKDGAKIMYLLNSKENNLFNGTLGTFVSRKGCHFIKVGNVDYALEKAILTKKEYVYDKDKDELILKEIGQIEQYPIILAYALSIYKSQDLTFDEVTGGFNQAMLSSRADVCITEQSANTGRTKDNSLIDSHIRHR